MTTPQPSTFTAGLTVAWRLGLMACLWSATLAEPSAAPGDILATFETEGAVFASPTLGRDGTLYIGSNNGRCYALNHHSGSLVEKWQYEAGDWIDSSVAIGPDGTLYFGTYDSLLVGLDPASGAERFAVAVGDAEGAYGVIQSSPPSPPTALSFSRRMPALFTPSTRAGSRSGHTKLELRP